ncbi:hypothetical protein MUK42_34110 [Musa troglodytarum]|uniref:Uncharacterized protein n=1 Tax=Musa troglodytarum TaxID=320322 RepID=A0A9E7FCN4_9LILI|nr:hypothetical protein MUK42_34110 [Musa troglodytarum]
MSEKMQQMAELDKMRKEFQWGLEVQKKADSGEDASGNCSIEQQQGDEDNKEEDREDREEDIDDGDSADNLRGQAHIHVGSENSAYATTHIFYVLDPNLQPILVPTDNDTNEVKAERKKK